MPDSEICDLILHLNNGEGLTFEGNLIAYRSALAYPKDDLKKKEISGKPDVLKYVFDIFLQNGSEIKKDFEVLTKGRKSEPLPDCVRLVNKTPKGEERKDIFIEEGATVECTTINTKSGPVYVGKGAVLMEGSCIRGPFAICEESEVRMGTKIYEGTTVGPHCKVGGEISNTMIFGYSNKAHDGYLGDAVIGEWCNIGAGANASNLKNDYSKIRVWNYRTRSFMRTDLQFCGLIMGDHSKVGVNCMINTATVMGVGVNLHGAGFPRTYLPCFSEGSATTGFDKVSLSKFLDIAERVMGRRGIKPSESEVTLLTHVYEMQEK